ncbi:MAG: beta-lactamase family protein [Clostridia bacterium]|nr:beta-lactamase family protein [Clostridia bacterium]
MYTFSDLEKYLDTVPAKEKTPGGSIRVFHHGNEVFRYSFGYADRENKIKMTGDEYYFMYSATKPITCATALHAWEEGAFILSEPVWWYLPEFKNTQVKVYKQDGSFDLVPQKREMVIQDLFTMSAGLNYDTSSAEIKKIVEETNGVAPTREVIKGIAKMPLEYQPRERWGYSFGHDVLAGVVEVATGVRFSEYMKKVIFEPLGMTKSTFRITDEIKEQMAQQYIFNYSTGEAEVKGKRNDYIFGSEYDSGGAGVITTIDDYAKFVQAMSCSGKAPNGKRILAPSTVKLMSTNMLDEKRMADFSTWRNNAEYGYGLGVRTKIYEGWGGNNCSIGEFGWDGAAGTLCSIDPEREIGIVYTQHMLNPHHEQIHPRIKMMVNLALGY